MSESTDANIAGIIKVMEIMTGTLERHEKRLAALEILEVSRLIGEGHIDPLEPETQTRPNHDGVDHFEVWLIFDGDNDPVHFSHVLDVQWDSDAYILLLGGGEIKGFAKRKVDEITVTSVTKR